MWGSVETGVSFVVFIINFPSFLKGHHLAKSRKTLGGDGRKK